MTRFSKGAASPIVRLYLASTHADGMIHAYLEDVSPDGSVSYLTEGMLRVVHRQAADPKLAPYRRLGVYRTYRRRDRLPLVPSEDAEPVIQLLADIRTDSTRSPDTSGHRRA